MAVSMVMRQQLIRVSAAVEVMAVLSMDLAPQISSMGRNATVGEYSAGTLQVKIAWIFDLYRTVQSENEMKN